MCFIDSIVNIYPRSPGLLLTGGKLARAVHVKYACDCISVCWEQGGICPSQLLIFMQVSAGWKCWSWLWASIPHKLTEAFYLFMPRPSQPTQLLSLCSLLPHKSMRTCQFGFQFALAVHTRNTERGRDRQMLHLCTLLSAYRCISVFEREGDVGLFPAIHCSPW